MRRLLAFLALIVGGVALADNGPVVYSPTNIVAGTTSCFPTRTPAGQIMLDPTGATFQCDSVSSKFVRRDLPPCPANPPTGAAPMGTAMCKRTDAAEIYGANGAGNWTNMTGSGGTVGGSSGQMQMNNSGAFAGVAGSNAVQSTGVVDFKTLNGVRNPARFATGGTGADLANCYTGWETVFDSGPAEVKFPIGHFCWNTAKQIQAVSATDRTGRWKVTGAGTGTFIYPRVVSALKIGPATGGTQATYGMELGGFTVALDQDLSYAHGIFEFERVQHPYVHDILFHGGPLLPGSGTTYNSYMGYLLEFDNTYGAGSIERIEGYGRRIYGFEMDDSTTAEELDSMHFDSWQFQSDLVGIVRFSTQGIHNLVFTNQKYQTIISDSTQTNQNDRSTFLNNEAAGQTVLDITETTAFDNDDMLFLGVGDKAELVKQVSKTSTTITVTPATRFAHTAGDPIYHGGIGWSFSGDRLVTFRGLMVEQCGAGILADTINFLSIDTALSSCKDLVRIDGPNSLGGTNALWNGSIKNVDLGLVPAVGTLTISSISTTTDRLTVPANTNTSTGCPVQYSVSGGSAPTSSPQIVSGSTYYPVRISDTQVKLATTAANAYAGTTIDFTTGGGGTQTLAVTPCVYGVHITSAGDSVNVRNIDFDHVERNPSSDDTLTAFQDDAGTFRNYRMWTSVSGSEVFERNYPTGYATPSGGFTTSVDKIVVGGVTRHEWFGNGAYYLSGAITMEGATFDAFQQSIRANDSLTADRFIQLPDSSGTVCLDTGSGCGSATGGAIIQVDGTTMSPTEGINLKSGTKIAWSSNQTTNPDEIVPSIVANSLTDNDLSLTANILFSKIALFDSASFRARLTDPNGTGHVLFDTGPVITSPTLQGFAASKCLQTDASGIITTITCVTGGSVTSVGLAAPAIFSVSNSPVTTTGTLTFGLVNQIANVVWAGPATSGAPAPPTFRQLNYDDLASAQFGTAIGWTVGKSGSVPTSNSTDVANGRVLRADGQWITPNAGTVTGTGVANQCAIWSGTTGINGNTGCTIDSDGDEVIKSVTTLDPGNGFRRVELIGNVAADPTVSAGSAAFYAKGSSGHEFPFWRNATDGIQAMLTPYSGAFGSLLTCTSGTCTIDNNKINGAMIALGSDTIGDIMYYNGTDWVRLAGGTTGQVLGANTGAAPSWGSAAGSEVRSMYWGAAAISTDGTNCATPTESTLNSGPKVWAFSCADSNSSVFYGSTVMPDGWTAGTVTFELELWHGTTETITFAGDFDAQCRGAGEIPSSTWGTAVAADVAITTANQNVNTTTAAVTAAGTCAAGDFLYWRYTVDAANFSTNSANAKVLGVKLEYTSSGGD